MDVFCKVYIPVTFSAAICVVLASAFAFFAGGEGLGFLLVRVLSVRPLVHSSQGAAMKGLEVSFAHQSLPDLFVISVSRSQLIELFYELFAQ